MNGLLPIILPFGALIAVATVMLSLGVLFINVGSSGTIIIGLAIIVLVPLLGALLASRNRDTSS